MRDEGFIKFGRGTDTVESLDEEDLEEWIAEADGADPSSPPPPADSIAYSDARSPPFDRWVPVDHRGSLSLASEILL